MNPKVANLIALELGILIAILAWLAFSNLSSLKQYPLAENQERTAGSFATVSPALKARNYQRYAADYRADRGREQQQDQEPAPTVRQYDQQIATSPYANSNLDDNAITYSSPSYAGVYEEPLPYPPDQFYSPYDQIVEYPQPNEIIVISNLRFFERRLRSPARFSGARMIVPHRRTGGRETHARGGGLVSHGGGLVPRRNVHGRSIPPSQGLRPR